MGLRDFFKGKKGGGNNGGGRSDEPSVPVDEGEITFADPDRGMLTTKRGLALNFHPNECRGFKPAAMNQVTIDRIEGMQAYGLSFVSELPQPRFSKPVIPDGAVEFLLREAQDASKAPQPLTVEALQARLPAIDWTRVFADVERKEDGLEPEALIEALGHLQRPFGRDEIEEILAVEPEVTSLQNPFTRIEHRWPHSWLSFLRWSNGGDFINGERGFQDMFSVAQVREYTTLYGIAHFLPGAIPFAMDGGAALYMFDTRERPNAGEYPIVFCHSSEVGGGWDSVTRLEDSFLACCKSTVDPNDADAA